MSTVGAPAWTSLMPVDMADVINETWQAIRHQEPDVPEAAVSIVAGRGSPHWRPDQRVLHVAERTVDAGSLEILAFLLHHAAHDLAPVATEGSEGKYHGNDYKAAAERLRLQVDYVQGNGWARTSITPEHEEIYQPQIKQLDAARAGWGPSNQQANRNGIVAQCQCHPSRKIRVRGAHAAEDLAEHPVICSVCGQPFIPVGGPQLAAEAR